MKKHHPTLACLFKWAGLFVVLAIPLRGDPSKTTYSGPPRTLSYQGILTNLDGSSIPDGTYSITFSLYDVETGGTALWTETQSVSTQKGIFNVILGNTSALTLPFDKPYWLGIKVGSDPEMVPRIALTSTAYSFRALDANSVGGIPASTTPGEGVLFPLGSGGKFPQAVLPEGLAPGAHAANHQEEGTDPLTVTTGMIQNNTIQGEDINTSTTITAGKVQGGGTTTGNCGVYGEGNYGVRGHGLVGVEGTGNTGVVAFGNTIGMSASGDSFGVESYSHRYGVYACGFAGVGVYGKGIRGVEGYGFDYGISGYSPSGYAGYFQGKVKVEGNMEISTYTNSPFPIAYGFVYSSGTLSKGTSNIASVTWNNTSLQYEIQISGESYYYSDYVTIVTPASQTVRSWYVSSGISKLFVILYDASGNKIQGHFQFVTYKP